jgi:hypothetical protein
MVSPVIEMLNWEKQSGVSGLPTQLLVLHSGECPLRGGYAQSLTTWASTPLAQGGPEASWHWFVDPIAIVNMIDPNYAAWHASEANPMSEGFEQGGYARFVRDDWLTAEGIKQMDNLAWLLARRALYNEIPPVWLTTAQITAITSGRDTVTKGFATHRQIDPETRTDPGDGYPYDVLLAKIKAYMNGTTPTPEEEDSMSYKRLLGKRVDGKWVRTRLAAGKTWHFADEPGTKALNMAIFGTGKHYGIELRLWGTNLPQGECLDVNFAVTPTGGKASYYFNKKVFGDKKGNFADVVPFSYGLSQAATINAIVTSSVESAYIDGYAVEVTATKLG